MKNANIIDNNEISMAEILSDFLGEIDNDIFAEAYLTDDAEKLAALKAKERREKGGIIPFKTPSFQKCVKTAAIIVAAILLLSGVTVATAHIIKLLSDKSGNEEPTGLSPTPTFLSSVSTPDAAETPTTEATQTAVSTPDGNITEAPVSTDFPEGEASDLPTETLAVTAAPTTAPTGESLRTKYSFYRYTLTYKDGVFYINFPEGNDDVWTDSGIVGPSSVSYGSLEELRTVVLTGTLSEVDISKMRSFYARNENGIILPDFYNLYVPVYPDGSSPTGKAVINREAGYTIGRVNIIREKTYNTAITEYNNFFNQEGITVTKTETISEKNATVYYYSDQDACEYKRVRYTITKGNKTAVVDEKHVLKNNGNMVDELHIYYKENGVYYSIVSRSPSEWPTEEWIMGHGIKPFDTPISAEILNQKDEEVMVVEKLTAMQKNHQTPETISVEGYEGGRLTPIAISVVDSEATIALKGDSPSDIKCVEQKGLKVWICDKDKNKIDYVYTNSKGVAFFEAPEGYYYFYFEGNDQYEVGSMVLYLCQKTFDFAFTEGPGIPAKKNTFTYRKGYENTTIRVADSVTGEPVDNVKISIYDDVLGYTDQNGLLELEPLISQYYRKGFGPGINLTFSREDFEPLTKVVDVTKSQIQIDLKKNVYYSFSFKFVDYDTGAPVSGVTVIPYEDGTVSYWRDENSRFYQTVSGDDGIISGIVSESDFAEWSFFLVDYDQNLGSYSASSGVEHILLIDETTEESIIVKIKFDGDNYSFV